MMRMTLPVLLFVASVGMAAVLEDFEGAYVGAGTLVADPENPANTVLHLSAVPGFNLAEVLSLPLPSGPATVTMRLYDFGANTDKTMDHYGPRWGFQGDGTGLDAFTQSCVNLLYKTYISGYKGYVANGFSAGNPMVSPTGTVSSPYWFMGTAGRYVKALDDIATIDVDESQGAWSTWTFEITPDTITVTTEANDVVDDTGVYSSGPVSSSGDIYGVGEASTVFVSAGTNDAAPIGDIKFVGVLVDDLTWTAAQTDSPGDANGDGHVDIQDFVLLKQNYGTTGGATWAQGDFNGDGNVDIQDFVILKQNYGS